MADNIFGVLLRVPAFCIGMGIAPLVQKNASINWLYVIVLDIMLYVALHYYLPKSNFPVLLAIPLLAVFTLGLRYFNTKKLKMNALTFMGIISLESYLTNIFFGGIFHRVPWGVFAYGNYIPYLCVVISVICCSVIVNRCVGIITNRLKQ